MRLAGFLVPFLLVAPAAFASEWREVPLDLTAPDFAPETEAPVATVSDAGLPDGRIASGTEDIARAWYEAPTERYAHAILGDGIEAGALVLEGRDGTRARLTLEKNHVFEDRTPRIIDLDGDGRAEVVTIRASRDGGGGVALYGLREGQVKEIASVPDIGTPNRWLNIAALDDLDGDGRAEIAFVRTPHIGGTLRVFTFDGAKLALIAEMWGFSNHAIGAREMRLSAVLDVEGERHLGLPSADRRAFRIVALRAGGLTEIASIATARRIEGPILAKAGGYHVGLAGGRVVRIAKEP